MSNFFSSSIGKKFFMSLTGLFLMFFLLVHLIINLMLIVGPDAYNKAAHFMATNPAIKIMEPILALGFIVHIIWASFLTIQNQRMRPIKYGVTKPGSSSKWASRNMFVLGSLLLLFLVIHMANFYIKMKFTGDDLLTHITVGGVAMENAYLLVSTMFIEYWWYDVIYLVSFLVLGYHLSHGFWSAFQTIGFSNFIWRKRLELFGKIYLLIVVAGFAIIPLFFLIFKS